MVHIDAQAHALARTRTRTRTRTNTHMKLNNCRYIRNGVLVERDWGNQFRSIRRTIYGYRLFGSI